MALGMTVEELADKAGLSQSYVTRLENRQRAKRGLPLATAEKLAVALKLDDVTDIMDLPRRANGAQPPPLDLQEDAEPYDYQRDDLLKELVRKRQNVVTYILKTDALSQIDLHKGDIVFLDISAEAFERLEPLQAVIGQLMVQVETPTGESIAMNKTTTIARQYVPPNLLITNSESVNAPILNMEVDPVAIRGVIIAKHRSLRK